MSRKMFKVSVKGFAPTALFLSLCLSLLGGESLETAKWQAAIDAMAERGGGRVVVTKGVAAKLGLPSTRHSKRVKNRVILFIVYGD